MSRPTVTGVVVAGGRSTRFGDRDKALAALDGDPLLRHAVETLGAVADEVVVNCRASQRGRFETALEGVDPTVRFAVDDRPDEGPLAGLATAFDAVETELAVALACDMPLAEPDAVRALLGRTTDDVDAVVPRTDGGPEPLHAVYRVTPAAAAARAALADGQRSLRALLERIDVRYLDISDAGFDRRSVRSVDTQDALAALEDERSEGG